MMLLDVRGLYMAWWLVRPLDKTSRTRVPGARSGVRASAPRSGTPTRAGGGRCGLRCRGRAGCALRGLRCRKKAHDRRLCDIYYELKNGRVRPTRSTYVAFQGPGPPYNPRMRARLPARGGAAGRPRPSISPTKHDYATPHARTHKDAQAQPSVCSTAPTTSPSSASPQPSTPKSMATG